jgi:hypothetical protein
VGSLHGTAGCDQPVATTTMSDALDQSRAVDLGEERTERLLAPDPMALCLQQLEPVPVVHLGSRTVLILEHFDRHLFKAAAMQAGIQRLDAQLRGGTEDTVELVE